MVTSCVLIGIHGEGIRGVLRLILGSSQQVMWCRCLLKVAEKALGLLSANSRSAGEGGTAGVVAVLRSTVEVVAESSKVAEGICRLVEVAMAEVTLVVVLVRVEGGGYAQLSTADFGGSRNLVGS